MSVPFNLNSVLATAQLVEGFDVIKSGFPTIGKYTGKVITYSDAIYDSLQCLVDDYQDWPEDQGFGSSDMTYARQSFIDFMIQFGNLSDKLETKFDPYLKVVNK